VCVYVSISHRVARAKQSTWRALKQTVKTQMSESVARALRDLDHLLQACSRARRSAWFSATGGLT